MRVHSSAEGVIHRQLDGQLIDEFRLSTTAHADQQLYCASAATTRFLLSAYLSKTIQTRLQAYNPGRTLRRHVGAALPHLIKHLNYLRAEV